MRSRLVLQEGGRTKRIETTWDFRTYDAGELRGLLAAVPEFEHVATYDFTYGPEYELDDDGLDKVLVLRRR